MGEKIGVLVVSADADEARKMKDALQRAKFEVWCAYSKGEAGSKAKEVEPAVVVMKLHLEQEYDGLMVALDLLDDEKTKGIPIVMIAPEGFSGERRTFRGRVLVEPVDEAQLVKEVEELIEARKIVDLMLC